jgi:hypothetical protein
MGLIGNPGLADNPAANGCLPAVQTLVSMGQWAYQMMFTALWANPQGLSIPDAFAALGTAYAAMVADMDALGQILVAEGVTLPAPPDGWTVTQNVDGSATVTPTS